MVLRVDDEYKSSLLAHRVSKSWAVMYSSSVRLSRGPAKLVISEELDAQIAVLELQFKEASGVSDADEALSRQLTVAIQNVRAAESTLRNIDYGREFSRLVTEQIRFRAGLALLSQG